MLRNIYERLRPLPLELSIEEGTLVVQNEDEVLCISENPNRKFDVSYFTLDRILAEATLRYCPEQIRDWYVKLRGLGGIENRGTQYVAVPHFMASFNAEQALGICLYLSRKMVSNDEMRKAN